MLPATLIRGNVSLHVCAGRASREGVSWMPQLNCTRPMSFAGPQRQVMFRRAIRQISGVRRVKNALPIWSTPALQTADADRASDASDASEEEDEGHISVGELLRFTGPTLGIWMINPILSLVDTSVVGTRSAIQLAALGPGTSLCDSLAYVCTFLATATTNMLALSLARRDRPQIGSTLSDAIVISCMMGVVVAVALYVFAPVVIAKMAGSSAAAIVPPAVEYVRWRALGMPAALLIFVSQAYFLAARDPVTPLLAAAFAGLVNLGGDLLLVNGLGLGIGGAAAATSFAQVVAAGALFSAMRTPLRQSSVLPGLVPELSFRLPTVKAARVFLSYAGPICGVLLSKVFMYGSLTATATHLGADFVGAHHIVVSLFAFFATVGDAVSTGAQAFLPEVVGRPGAARRMGWDLMTAGMWVGVGNSILAGTVLLMGRGAFTRSPAVLAASQTLLPFLCVALLVHTCSMASEGMLLAGRDLGFLVRSYIGNLCLALCALALTQRASAGILGVWWTLIQFQATRLVWNSIRLRTAASPLEATQPLRSLAH